MKGKQLRKNLRSKKANSKRQANRRLDFRYQVLEPKQLLAGDLFADFDAQPVHNVFSKDAVTVEQILERAEHRPYVEGELIVAVEYDAALTSPERIAGDLSQRLRAGVDGAILPFNTMLTTNNANMDVSLVSLQIDSTMTVVEALQEVDQFAHVLWASPNFYQNESPIELIPNDPEYPNQYHHPLMQNNLAWDFSLGDSSIIVGITDDGVDLDHPDIQNNIYVNPGEIAGNGVDDDGNGYVDDVNGWDFSNDNNNPDPDQSDHGHGTHVAGITAAETDNGIGVAGTGGNVTILPLQFYRYVSSAWTAAVINETYVYAADNGAQIVSTSYNVDGWVGDPVVTAGLQYMHDAGLIHFNSAGNGGSVNPPRQSFEQSLFVVSTDNTDTRSSFSNWGTGVDISAPGSDVLSLAVGTGYTENSGTSMAAPNAAGVAALIWSQNPTWNRDQVIAQLLGTADNIDALNPAEAGLLGAGRANSFRAMSETLGAPMVTSIMGLPPEGTETTDTAIENFQIRFDQYLDPASANNPSSYLLTRSGLDQTFGTADDQNIPVALTSQYMTGSNGVSIEVVNGSLGYGDYRVTVTDSLENPFGTSLDGDGDGTAGGVLTYDFSITPGDAKLAQPLGSQVYGWTFSDAVSNAGESNSYFFDFDENQTLSISVQADGLRSPAVSVISPTGDTIDTLTGSTGSVTLNNVYLSEGGSYGIAVGGDELEVGAYTIQIALNSSLEVESDFGASNDTLGTAEDINDSSITFGADAERLAVYGNLRTDPGTVVEFENFDSGVLGPEWTTSSSDANGRILLTGDFGTAAGANAIIMDNVDTSVDNLNEAIWEVDLTSFSTPILKFAYAEWSDEETSLPTSFTGSENGDGVSISDDGITWHTILNAPDSPAGEWIDVQYDLTQLASDFGLTLGSNFQVKFQQFDNFDAPTDGRGYDEIEILTPNTYEDWFTFSLEDGEQVTIAAGATPVSVSEQANFLRLYDASGTLIATGSPSNGTVSIPSYVDPTNNGTADDYYVQLIGANAEYNLVVTRNAEFDVEPNDSTAEAIELTDVGGVFGYLLNSFAGTAEPDDFTAGSQIDTVFEGVTLSNPIGNGVFAASASFGAPTGTIVFAPAPNAASGWREADNIFRADFDSPTSTVSIDVGSDDTSDVAYLRAFSSTGQLLAEVVSSSISSGNSETLTISRPGSDIAYIEAAGVGTDITPLDNLVFGLAGSDDYYTLDVSAGDLISLNAFLPGAGPFSFDNGLEENGSSSLLIELYSPSGTLIASDSEAIELTASETGTYEILITSTGGSGEYVLLKDPISNVPNGIDFGPVGSEVWPGYELVTDDGYTVARGFGWTETAGLTSFEGARGNSLIRDRVSMRTGTFVVDAPNGTYNIDVYLGQVRKLDQIQIQVEDVTDTFTPRPGPNVIKSYTVDVTDGQLTFDFDGLAGLDNRIFVAGIGINPVNGRDASGSDTGNEASNLDQYWQPVHVDATDYGQEIASEERARPDVPQFVVSQPSRLEQPFKNGLNLERNIKTDSLFENVQEIEAFETDLELSELF